jgi:plastocyanin
LKLALAAYCAFGVSATAQTVTVTGHVAAHGGVTASNKVSAVVWLTPLGTQGSDAPAVKPMHAVLRQKDKQFEPHLLVVTKGSTVDFPNLDPWFHNVFSLFNGKKFDLGLYEAGSMRTVHFDREGVSYIFCNIHPEMSAIVVVVPSSHFAVSDRTGEFAVPGVAPGRYTLHVWSENALPESLTSLAREVELVGSTYSVGTLRLRMAETSSAQHKNKYGQDYEPPSPGNPVYPQP